MGEAQDLLPGTLDLLILRALARGAMHGYGVAQYLRTVSDDVLQVGESSLYPALQRLLLNGWVKAEWGASENNRRARYYTLTAAGELQSAAGGSGQPAEALGRAALGLKRYAAFCRCRRPSSSAICTALSAAPLRRLSDTHQRLRPLSMVESSRTRLM